MNRRALWAVVLGLPLAWVGALLFWFHSSVLDHPHSWCLEQGNRDIGGQHSQWVYSLLCVILDHLLGLSGLQFSLLENEQSDPSSQSAWEGNWIICGK